MKDITINGLRFVCTCIACPEQYDVFKGPLRVGYVRLRHGAFRVDYPDCGDETLLTGEPRGDGEFDSDEERFAWLTKAALSINARMEKTQ